jgi:hypothetical protein
LILLAHWLLDHLLPVHSQQLLQAEEAAQVDSTLFVEMKVESTLTTNRQTRPGFLMSLEQD